MPGNNDSWVLFVLYFAAVARLCVYFVMVAFCCVPGICIYIYFVGVLCAPPLFFLVCWRGACDVSCLLRVYMCLSCVCVFFFAFLCAYHSVAR